MTLFPEPFEINYNGKPFTSRTISMDTETVLIERKDSVPELVLCSASDGERTMVFPRRQLVDFLQDHLHCTLAFHNAAFDVLVIAPYYPAIWERVDSHKVGDTMLLDMLIRLATRSKNLDAVDSSMFARPLDKLAAAYGRELNIHEMPDKKSPYRTRFGELLGIENLEKAPRGFLEYAASDAAITQRLYAAMSRKAHDLARSYNVHSSVIEKYGPLSHFLQVKAAIALYQISLNGMPFDRTQASGLEESIRKSLMEDIHWMDSQHPDLFKRYKKGTRDFMIADKSQLPQMNNGILRDWLKKTCEQHGIQVPLSQGKNTDLVTTKQSELEKLRDLDPLIDKILHFKDKGKILSFFNMFKMPDIENDRIRSRYGIMTRTGRTSSSNINLQQIPNRYDFKTVFRAPAGRLLATIDYAAIELRTLAFICESLFGTSVMGDKIRSGVDLHSYTASTINNIPYDEFVTNAKEKKYKAMRQEAKAANFGFPGGLGIDTFIEFAELSYGVIFSRNAAMKFRNDFLKKVFPEIGRYLSEDPLNDLSLNLGMDYEKVATVVGQISVSPSLSASMVVSVLKNPGHATAGNRNKVQAVLDQLLFLATNPPQEARDMVKQDRLVPELYDILFAKNAVTTTGRVRSQCTYTQSRNTPFQGLASDGAKLALYRLVKEGFKVCAFIHDEVVCEVRDEAEAQQAKRIMEDEMARVMNHTMPVECSLQVSGHWEK